MKLFKNIFLILVLVLTTFCNQVTFGAEQARCTNSKNTITISTTHKENRINSKNNKFSINAIDNNETTLSNRRNDNNQNSNNTNNENVITTSNFDNLLEYIYSYNYLENNSQLALRFLLFQMQPNAP